VSDICTTTMEGSSLFKYEDYKCQADDNPHGTSNSKPVTHFPRFVPVGLSVQWNVQFYDRIL